MAWRYIASAYGDDKHGGLGGHRTPPHHGTCNADVVKSTLMADTCLRVNGVANHHVAELSIVAANKLCASA